LEPSSDNFQGFKFLFKIVLMITVNTSESILLVIQDLVKLFSIDLMRPPIESVYIITIGDDLRFRTQIWQVEVFLKNTINLPENLSKLVGRNPF